MNPKQSVTITAPSIVVVQDAYVSFFAPSESTETECTLDTVEYRLVDVDVQFATLVDTRIANWLTFERLVEEWKDQRGAASSITETALCPAYQSIIGMGEPVIPFLLRQLHDEGDEPDQWFWALSSIARVNPVDDADRGNYVRMAHTWLAWGEREGYAW